MTCKFIVTLVSSLILFRAGSIAQTLTVLGNPPPLTIQTSSQVTNGKSQDHMTLRVNYSILNLLKDLELYVRTTSANMTSTSGYSIPVNKMGIQVILPLNADPEVFLSTSEQRLFSFPLSVVANLFGALFNITIRYRMLGGTHLLVPQSNYTMTLVFRAVLD